MSFVIQLYVAMRIRDNATILSRHVYCSIRGQTPEVTVVLPTVSLVPLFRAETKLTTRNYVQRFDRNMFRLFQHVDSSPRNLLSL